ncbi:hypothetical protein I302_107311 [Kwoniella bestiolae CBS 10118]|uniref:F-box domain-containing protein n=1 Tax=Kwoniella bestiolae CBS 10118 TaxID=1296100 RepID=A0A1B9FYW5_9TREE|nr:hypothetical protein I302_06953 [Kwoniella bestiolae CBS 10118]OCF23967.1 hypothetical protein I302_06953 [Kwoniella bestiolae CBS 10118]
MEHLDDFLVELAFRKLPLHDLLSCSAVSKRFNKIISSSTKIQLFLHNHLFARSDPATTDHLERPSKSFKDSSTIDQLGKLLRSEDNLLKFKPHLHSYELPANQKICAIGDECVVTSCTSGAEIIPDKDGLCTLVTIWTPDENDDGDKLKAKPVKVDFKPNTEAKSRAVDVKDDVIVCVQELESGGDTVFRIRILHLFNNGEIARPWQSDEITRTTQDMGLDNAPRVIMGREGLLVVITPFSMKWTRWTEGKDCTWGVIQKPAYLGFSSSIRAYGPDILGIVGQCIPPLSDNPFAPPPVPKDHLLIYHLRDDARNTLIRPKAILRMPYGRNEFPESFRAAIQHGEPEEVVFPGVLANSNNGRSSIVRINMTLMEDPDGEAPWPENYPSWAIIDIPIKTIRKYLGLISQRITDPESDSRRYPTRRQTKPSSSDPQNQYLYQRSKRCECCAPVSEKSETLGDLPVITPSQWTHQSLTSYERCLANMSEYSSIFGSRTVSYFVSYNDFERTEGNALLELFCVNFRSESHYEPGRHKALGGLGKSIKLPKRHKDTGRLRPSLFGTHESRDHDCTAHTTYRGHWKTLPAKGFIENVLFDGDQVIFEYEGGWLIVLDFA